MIKKLCKYFILILLCQSVVVTAKANRHTIDSLFKVYKTQSTDTTRLLAMWDIIDYYMNVRPDTALLYASGALRESKKIKYQHGISLFTKQTADAYKVLGDYSTALQLYLERLKMDEKESDNYKSVVTRLNISAVYIKEHDFENAIKYLEKANAIVQSDTSLVTLGIGVLINFSDLYDKKGNPDKAAIFAQRSLDTAKKYKDSLRVGFSYNNLGNANLHLAQYKTALQNYQQGLVYLLNANQLEFICETYAGMAEVYFALGAKDSAIYYALKANSIARENNFNEQLIRANELLTHFFQSTGKFEAAFTYQSNLIQLKDSLFNEEKERKLQAITIAEEIRQQEREESLKEAVKERAEQMQMLLIGLIIPLFFFLSMFLSKRKIKPRVIEFSGILSLLLLFEYVTLWLHPAIANLTNHTPFYEIIILVIVAAILTPAHHKIEHWMVHKLTTQKHKKPEA